MASASVRTATVVSDVTACVGTAANARPKELVTVVLRVDVANCVLNQDVLACTTLTAVGMVNVLRQPQLSRGPVCVIRVGKEKAVMYRTVHRTVTIGASVTFSLPSHNAATAVKGGWERHVRNLVMARSIPWTVDCVCAMTTAHMASIVSQCATTTSESASTTGATVPMKLQVSTRAILGRFVSEKVVLESLIVNAITMASAT